jgi:hypothetical protein
MSAGEDPDPSSGMMYFIDFAEKIRENWPHSSWILLVEEVQFVRRAGPEMARAMKVAEGIYRISVHIGGGTRAIIEFERDRNGQCQPILGGFSP